MQFYMYIPANSSFYYSASRVVVLGVEFRQGALVCLRAPSNSEYPVFGEIRKIFIPDSSKIFLVQLYNTDYFSHHLFAYCITQTNSYTMLDVGSLKIHAIYHKYYMQSSIYTTVRSCHSVELDI